MRALRTQMSARFSNYHAMKSRLSRLVTAANQNTKYEERRAKKKGPRIKPFVDGGLFLRSSLFALRSLHFLVTRRRTASRLQSTKNEKNPTSAHRVRRHLLDFQILPRDPNAASLNSGTDRWSSAAPGLFSS